MIITAATAAHAAGIARVHVRAWQVGYAEILDPIFLRSMSITQRTERWQHILTLRESETLVALADGDVRGFISYGACRDEGAPPTQGEIWALYVEPERWGTGFGRALLAQALAHLEQRGQPAASLWVLSENHRGRRFYTAGGFHPVPHTSKRFQLGGREVEEVCLALNQPPTRAN
jgi:GNAT superfamily N-acetyltransferase